MKKLLLLVSLASFLLTSCKQNKKEQTSTQDSIQTLGLAPIAVLEKTNTDETNPVKFYPGLLQYVSLLLKDMDAISQERKTELNKIALYIQKKQQENEPTNITFICTHNSRRSHLSQIWAQTAAAFYGLDKTIITYSGGTEATAFNGRAVATLERAGFIIQNPGGENPHYIVKYGENSQAMTCFSKKYNDSSNVQANFLAVMTCSQADKNCPLVKGAAQRVSLPYSDPKIADGKPNEKATYDERSKQIATEMFYIMSLIKQ